MEDRLDQPRHRKKPTMYFVNSMSDLFQEDVSFTYVEKVIAVIESTHWHTYQILTKRADRMAEFFTSRPVPDNAWLGVSVEDKKYGVPRIASLKMIKAKTKFLSIEPLLEDLGIINLKAINWAIVGGESGANARPMEKIWVIKIKKQCESNGVGFFFKQWGTWGSDGIKRNKSANGRILDGKTWDMMPRYM
jgi:protein gp37